MQSDARVDVLERIQDIDIRDEAGTRHVSDAVIELAETGDSFRRIVFEDVDGEEITYLTTLSPAEYDSVDVLEIYQLLRRQFEAGALSLPDDDDLIDG